MLVCAICRNRDCDGRPCPGDADEAVIRDYRNSQVHDKENGDRFGRLPLHQDVDVGKPQDQGDRHRHAREQPARRRADPGDDRPGNARDHDPDHGQLRVVGKLEVRVAPSSGEGRLPNDHEQRVGRERADDGDNRGDQDAARGRLPVGRREVHPKHAQGPVNGLRQLNRQCSSRCPRRFPRRIRT
jgi:hypothetical protein